MNPQYYNGYPPQYGSPNDMNMNPNMYMNMNPNMAMGMGMGMGGMGMMGMNGGGVFNGMFMYRGNPMGLQTRLESMTPDQINSIREAVISCEGTQIKQVNLCCYICTIIWGSILIFPLFFLCCDWWQRIAFPAFDIPLSTYQSLQRVFSSLSLQTITLSVVDNKLNAQKCQLIYDMLSRSQLKGFSFVNSTGRYDYESDQCSHFAQRMRPIKKLPIQSEIKWGTQLVM